nr:MAG TPA: hypothetical protein [Caudoviricetes sp.]DAR45700.1 MAG TPA: hypothetical protein [Bacteriophage sp.]
MKKLLYLLQLKKKYKTKDIILYIYDSYGKA